MPPPMPPKNKKDFSWGRFSKTLSFWILILLVPVALIQLSTARAEQAPEIPYTRYREELERNNILKVTIQAGKVVRGDFRDRIAVNGRDVKRFTSQLPMENSEDEVKALREKRVQIQAEDAQAFSFGKSKAKLLTGDTPKVTFADVAGADEAKQELQEIIEFLKDPQKFTRLGGRLPKG